MNITIIAVGKIKEKYLNQGMDEYKKRLSKYCKLNIIEIPDKKAPENLSITEMNNIKDREGEGILRHIRDNMYVIALDIKGEMLESEKLSQKINNLALDGKSNLVFIIGGSLGLSENVLEVSDYKLSFSPMTFPHQLMRMILLEQVYRSFRIMKGEPYHRK